EEVEHFKHAVDVAAAAERDALLQAHVDTVERLANQLRAVEQELAVIRLSLHRAAAQRAERFGGRAGRRQDAEIGAAGVAEIASPRRVEALAGSVEVD